VSAPTPVTYAAAAVHYDSDTNPRWVACHAALGRAPQGYEYIIWVQQQWRAFATERSFSGRGAVDELRRTLGTLTDDEFDLWLVRGAATR
jgi:hypothetical protein